MKNKYVAPSYRSNGFTCPFCNVYANQNWGNPNKLIHYWINHTAADRGSGNDFSIAECSHCGKFTIWVDEKLVYPRCVVAPQCNKDLPQDIQDDFEEARQIALDSPKGATALLRLVIQKICILLGEKGKNVNHDIAELVKKGLPVKIQQALDIVRVVGNNAVHPGQIDFDDGADVASKLFELVNLISDVMITQPKHVADLYSSVMPEEQRKAIDKRDR